MNKQEAFVEINKLQDEYVEELIGLINSYGIFFYESYQLYISYRNW